MVLNRIVYKWDKNAGWKRIVQLKSIDKAPRPEYLDNLLRAKK